MSKNGKTLVIVESGAKAKKIQGYLGPAYRVIASGGHIRDLDTKNGVVVEDEGIAVKYVISGDKKKTVSTIKDAAKTAKEVLLGSDKDREGEAIAWHLAKVMQLDPNNAKRIVFTEVTEKALKKAVREPRQIDMNLVDAQQARRVLDMLLGFELSPLLSRAFTEDGLSAGRVQSVVNRLIIEREDAINNFTSESYYQAEGQFKVGDNILKGVYSEKFPDHQIGSGFIQHCFDRKTNPCLFTVGKVTERTRTSDPSPPFETATLQQFAGRIMSRTAQDIMKSAQSLYENGHITYHRTDSTEISQDALESLGEWIISNMGEEYHRRMEYATKAEDAQEAHEAIRPTNPSVTPDELEASNNDERKLYEIIWKRTVASQMAPARFQVVDLQIHTLEIPPAENFTISEEKLVFDGHLRIYPENIPNQTDSETKIQSLLKLEPGQPVNYTGITVAQKLTKSRTRFTEPTLVKELKRIKIGRPSTYATMVTKVQEKGYVVVGSTPGVEVELNIMDFTPESTEINQATEKTTIGAEKKKLLPTDLGRQVNTFLCEHFAQILDLKFTAKLEKKLDKVAAGQQEWQTTVRFFYDAFHPNVLVLREQYPAQPRPGQSGFTKRLVGVHRESGLNMYAYTSKNGPVLQIGEDSMDKSEKRFLNITKAQVKSITEDEANALKCYPLKVGVYQDRDILIKTGTFGEYICWGDLKINLKDNPDPNLDKCIELIDAQNKKVIKVISSTCKVQNGPYGPYVLCDGKIASVPSDVDPAELTLEDCQQLVENVKAKPQSSGRGSASGGRGRGSSRGGSRGRGKK